MSVEAVFSSSFVGEEGGGGVAYLSNILIFVSTFMLTRYLAAFGSLDLNVFHLNLTLCLFKKRLIYVA